MATSEAHRLQTLDLLDACARTARSLKGVARLYGLAPGAELARQLEQCFATAQRGAGVSADGIDPSARSTEPIDSLAPLFATSGRFAEAGGNAAHGAHAGASRSYSGCDALRQLKRVLVVNDSSAAREIQRELLVRSGYEVDFAVDGIDGWNAIRSGCFDLVLADIDMPLVDGIRLTRHIREDAALQCLAVLIVCEKDCAAQRRRVFEAGADYYVIEESARETLTQTVASLIGSA